MAGANLGSMQGNTVNAVNGQQFIPEIWSKEILAFRRATMLSFDMCKQIEIGSMKKGDTVHIPRMSELTVEDKVPNIPVSIQSNTDTDLIITLDTDRDCAFALDSYLDAVSSYDVRKPYLEAMSYALDRDITGTILGLRGAIMTDPLRSVFVSSTGTIAGNGQPFNFAGFLNARRILMEANVPRKDWRLYVSPGQEGAIYNIPQFTSADFISNQPIPNGAIGSLMGVPVIVTSLISANSATGWVVGSNPGEPTPGFTGSRYIPKQDTFTTLPATFAGNSLPVHTALLCHKEWAAAANPVKPKVTQSWENRDQAWLFVGRQVYGARLYRPDHAVLIHTSGTII